MPRFEIIFTRYYSYDIEAETEDEAVEEAKEMFVTDMRYPIAGYDDIEVIEMEEVEVREIDGE